MRPFMLDEAPPVNYLGQLLQMLGVTGVLLAALLVMLWAARWMQKRRWQSAGAVNLLSRRESLAISPKTTLHVIDCGSKRILVAESSEEVCLLGEMAAFRMEAIKTEGPAEALDGEKSFSGTTPNPINS